MLLRTSADGDTMRRFEAFAVGPLGCNCALVWDPDTGTGVVLDPGDEASRIRSRVEALGFRPEMILLTHGHFDHVGAARELQDSWGCPVLLAEADRHLVEALELQTRLFGVRPVPEPRITALPLDGMPFGLKVLPTPGHSQGSVGFFGEMEGGPVVFCGDTLFKGGVGRTDLMGGSWSRLETSIREQLYTLPPETRAVPGHGPETSIGEEIASNPFVRG